MPLRIPTTAFALALATVAGPSPRRPSPAPVRYAIDGSSVFEVHTGKAGLLGAFGHEHVIRAATVTGTIVHDPDRIARSSVRIEIPTSGLRVVREGADRKDADEVEAAMFADVLPPERFPRIVFESRTVTGDPRKPRVVGTLTLAGTARPIGVDVALETAGDTLRAKGRFAFDQSDFGIDPYSAAAGTIKVADEVEIVFEAVGVRGSAGR